MDRWIGRMIGRTVDGWMDDGRYNDGYMDR